MYRQEVLAVFVLFISLIGAYPDKGKSMSARDLISKWNEFNYKLS